MNLKWQGLPSHRFKKYQSWINSNHPGICGTYCASVIVHDRVYQDTKKDLDKDALLTGLHQLVDKYHIYNGTFMWDIWTGLSVFLKSLPELKVKMSIRTEKMVKELLGGPNKKPIIIGTTGLLGSPYGNHWLVCYAFREDEEGNLFYRCYDNHGRYQAEVHANHTVGCVWLD